MIDMYVSNQRVSLTFCYFLVCFSVSLFLFILFLFFFFFGLSISFLIPFAADHLELVNEDDEKGSSFTNAKYNMKDSFEIQFDYSIDEGYDCGFWCSGALGRAEGFALVLTDQAANSIGSHGDPGQGYKNMGGKSFAVVFDSYGAGTADRTVRFARNGNLESLCNNPLFSSCTAGYILKETGFDGSSYDFIESRKTVKLIYDGIRHNMFLKIKYGSNWLTALQATVNLEQIFGTNIGNVRIGFTASNGNFYFDTDKIYSLRYRRAELNAAQSLVVENGRTVGAVHDEHSKPFTLTIDGKDVCGHDRSVGGESISVRLVHIVNNALVVNVPTNCGGTTSVGTCEKTVTNPGSHPANQEVGGLFEIRFLTSTSGFYDVKMTVTAGGHAEATIGRVFVAE